VAFTAINQATSPVWLTAEGFDRDCGESRELTRSELAAASFPRRLGEASARLLSPLL